MKPIILFCYSFVFGIAMPMIFAPDYPAWEVKFIGFSLTYWFFFFSILCGILSFLLYKRKQKSEFIFSGDRAGTETRPYFHLSSFFFHLFLAFCSLFLAVANYYRAVDSSSPHHILHFLDQSIADKTLVRGTIIHDPDDRGTHTFIDIQPEEIVQYSNREFEIDWNHPHIEFRTKIERVVDGDTVELFESPPVWLFPDFELDAGSSVRLLGLNAPEIPHPKRYVQESGLDAEPGGEEAKAFLQKLLEGKSVILKISKTEPQDRYRRWLALVYVGTAGNKTQDARRKTQDARVKSVNEMMLENNFAKVAFLQTDGFVKLKPEPPVKLSGKTGLVRSKIFPSVGEELYASLAYGQRVEVVEALLEPQRQTNPAGFDYGKFLMARNIYAMTLPIKKSEKIKLIGEGEMNPLVAFSLNLKKKMTAAIRETMPYPTSAFLGGVTLGLRGGVPADVKKEFQATGVAHVLAVSGLHVGFVAVLLIAISKVFNLPKKLAFVFMVFGLTVFAIITGASPATTRVALMFSIGQFIYSFCGFGLRRTTVLTIPIAAFIILLRDPLKLPDGSFVLSFMAVWSLAHLSGPIAKFFRWNSFTKGFFYFPYFFSLVVLTLVSFISISGEITILREKFALFKNIPLLNELLPHYRWTLAGVYGLGVLFYFLFKWIGKMDLIESGYRNAAVKGALIFTCAQLAILIGMMWPLSSIYFQRFPISGSFANFLAIPLIGFNVQYGLIASSLITMTNLFFGGGIENFFVSVIGLSYTPVGFALLISGVVLIFFAGTLTVRTLRNIHDPFFSLREELLKFAPSIIFIIGFLFLSILETKYKTASEIALTIQGFNWALCEGFLSMAKNWAGYIPYPYVDTMTPLQTLSYYGAVLLIAFHQPLWNLCKRVTLPTAANSKKFAPSFSSMSPPSASP